MVIQSTRKGYSIYDEIKERLYIQRLISMRLASENYIDDELDEALEDIDDNYDLNLFKLDELHILADSSDEVKRKFISQKLYIENINIPEQSKLEHILTTACLLNYHSDLLMNLSENELYILSIASLSIGNKFGFDLNYKAMLKTQINLMIPVFTKSIDDKQYILK